jgi:hypothetical protein
LFEKAQSRRAFSRNIQYNIAMSRQKLEQEIESNRLKRVSNEFLGQKLIQKHSSLLGNLVVAESILAHPSVLFDLYQVKPTEKVNNLKTRENLIKVIASQDEGLVAQGYLYLAYLDFIEENQPLETMKKCNLQNLSVIAIANTFGAVTIVMYHTIYSICNILHSLDLYVC